MRCAWATRISEANCRTVRGRLRRRVSRWIPPGTVLRTAPALLKERRWGEGAAGVVAGAQVVVGLVSTWDMIDLTSCLGLGSRRCSQHLRGPLLGMAPDRDRRQYRRSPSRTTPP